MKITGKGESAGDGLPVSSRDRGNADISNFTTDSTRQQLAPSNVIGFAYTALATTLTVAASILAIQPIGFTWLLGQVLFALAFLEWFLIIHEAGHRTLFKHRLLNQLVGTIAGFFTLIPYSSWRHIHARHHVWTGWQDMDATTATLVPRKLANW